MNSEPDLEFKQPTSYDNFGLTPEELVYFRREIAADLGTLALASVSGGLAGTPENPAYSEKDKTVERPRPELAERHLGAAAIINQLYDPETKVIDLSRANRNEI